MAGLLQASPAAFLFFPYNHKQKHNGTHSLTVHAQYIGMNDQENGDKTLLE